VIGEKMTPPMKDMNIVMIGLCEVLDGLIAICSFGAFHPDSVSKYIDWKRGL